MSALMVMGTGSDVGKSLIVAGLCRAYRNRGMRVCPFKPQNMSNNAAVTADGGEIGRAQALQAQAAGMLLSVHMNPVLLKPETDIGSQVIVQGKRVATMSARDYFRERARFLPAILESYQRLKAEADLVLIEGAGSPAEINLRDNDLANMGFAEAADVPVLLVGDIHRGGVIASLIGTRAVLTEPDARRIKAFLINNFHGDIRLFDDGVRMIRERTGWVSAGVVPHFSAARNLPAEDALALDRVLSGAGAIKIAVPRLSRIANFDDLDPLRLEDGVSVVFVQPGEALPGDAALVLLPGSKSTLADMAYFRAQGWDIDLEAHVRRGGRVLGLCGGYQMLGRMIHDPEGIEGPAASLAGLGLLDIETTLTPNKALITRMATHLETGAPMRGYEMHLGLSRGPARARPFAVLNGDLGHSEPRDEGAVSPDGRIAGTYLHGIFAEDGFRRAFLKGIGFAGSGNSYGALIEETLDGLARHLEAHIDLDRLLAIAAEERR